MSKSGLESCRAEYNRIRDTARAQGFSADPRAEQERRDAKAASALATVFIGALAAGAGSPGTGGYNGRDPNWEENVCSAPAAAATC